MTSAREKAGLKLGKDLQGKSVLRERRDGKKSDVRFSTVHFINKKRKKFATYIQALSVEKKKSFNFKVFPTRLLKFSTLVKVFHISS